MDNAFIEPFHAFLKREWINCFKNFITGMFHLFFPVFDFLIFIGNDKFLILDYFFLKFYYFELFFARFFDLGDVSFILFNL